MTDPTPLIQPEVTDLASLGPSLLQADQQQQQQQQQVAKRQVTRTLNADTGLPQEEIVQNLTTQLKQTNTIAPRNTTGT